MKKNIFFVMPQLGGGGGERVISILLNNINRNLYKPNLIILKKNGADDFLKDLKEDVTTHFLNISNPIKISFPIIIFRLFKLIKNKKCDIVFFGSGQINALFSPFLFLLPDKCKSIARESNIPSQFEKYNIIKWFYKFFYKSYDNIIVQSDDMYFDLNTNFNVPKNKLIKINNPIDANYIEAKLLPRDQCEFPSGKFNILVAGRLTYQKGFDLLFDELAKINDVNYHLTVLGNGEEKESLIEKINYLNLNDKVSFMGNVDNPYKYMEKSDLFLLSSRFEGFPNVVLEALYCGTPVLANNCLGGISEIITPGFNGSIFEYGLNNFEEKLRMIINGSFDSVKLKMDIIERFSVETKILDFEKVFKNL